MAFLVEHRSLNEGTSQSNVDLVHQHPLQERSKSSSTMKMMSALRRGSATVSDENISQPLRRASTTEPERRSSLATMPLRLRRKKTQKTNELKEEDEQAASQLGRMFFSLPSEILTSVISYLTLEDIFHLRQASQATLTILDHNASTVTRFMLHQILPEECIYHVPALYSIPSPCQSTLHLLRTCHRQRTIDRTIYNTLSFIQMRIYMLTPQFPNAGSQFPNNRHKLMLALQRPAWTVYHFIESFREILIKTHDTKHDASVGKFWSCHLCKEATQDLVNTYPVQELKGAYHFYQLMHTHLRAATRAPTFAGTIERKLRGWGKNPASDEDLSFLVVLGGMEILSKISMMQGSYDIRLKTVSTFIDKVKYHVDVNTNLRGLNLTLPRHITANDMSDDSAPLTDSLDPPFAILRQDHLDRLPTLHEFFLPIWEERMIREGLVASETDFEGPFQWVQKIIYGESETRVGLEASPPIPVPVAMAMSMPHSAYYGAPPV